MNVNSQVTQGPYSLFFLPSTVVNDVVVLLTNVTVVVVSNDVVVVPVVSSGVTAWLLALFRTTNDKRLIFIILCYLDIKIE